MSSPFLNQVIAIVPDVSGLAWPLGAVPVGQYMTGLPWESFQVRQYDTLQHDDTTAPTTRAARGNYQVCADSAPYLRDNN